MNVWRKGLEGSYWLGISIREHRYDMFFGTDINSGRVRVDEREALQMNSFIGFVFLFAHSF
jgi:hypothetical protein